MDRGSGRRYVPEVLPESTANTGISMHNVRCPKGMLKGGTNLCVEDTEEGAARGAAQVLSKLKSNTVYFWCGNFRPVPKLVQ